MEWALDIGVAFGVLVTGLILGRLWHRWVHSQPDDEQYKDYCQHLRRKHPELVDPVTIQQYEIAHATHMKVVEHLVTSGRVKAAVYALTSLAKHFPFTPTCYSAPAAILPAKEAISEDNGDKMQPVPAPEAVAVPIGARAVPEFEDDLDEIRPAPAAVAAPIEADGRLRRPVPAPRQRQQQQHVTEPVANQNPRNAIVRRLMSQANVPWQGQHTLSTEQLQASLLNFSEKGYGALTVATPFARMIPDLPETSGVGGRFTSVTTATSIYGLCSCATLKSES